MGRDLPSLDDLRRIAALQGVDPTDEDLEAVLGFYRVLLPAFAEAEKLIPPGEVPLDARLPEDPS